MWPLSHNMYLMPCETYTDCRCMSSSERQPCAGVAEHAQSALLQELPSRWERLGDLVLLPADAMTSSTWHEHEPAVWQVMAAALQCRRIARQARIAPTGTSQCSLSPVDAGAEMHHLLCKLSVCFRTCIEPPHWQQQ